MLNEKNPIDSTTGNYRSEADPSQFDEESVSQVLTQAESECSGEIDELEHEDIEVFATTDPPTADIEPTPSTSYTPVTAAGQRKRRINAASERTASAEALESKMHNIIDIVGDVTSSMQNQIANRHKDFCSYLGQRMSMLPMRVARDLEVEFTKRVNELIDIHCDE